MTTHQQQAGLYTRLQEVLGTEPATTLMMMLPTKGELATRNDLDLLRTELREEMNGLRGEMNGLRDEMHGFRVEVNERLTETRSELKSEMRELRATMRDYDVALRGFVRTFLTTQAATVIAIVGIVLGFERLT